MHSFDYRCKNCTPRCASLFSIIIYAGILMAASYLPANTGLPSKVNPLIAVGCIVFLNGVVERIRSRRLLLKEFSEFNLRGKNLIHNISCELRVSIGLLSHCQWGVWLTLKPVGVFLPEISHLGPDHHLAVSLVRVPLKIFLVILFSRVKIFKRGHLGNNWGCPDFLTYQICHDLFNTYFLTLIAIEDG